MSEWTLNGSSLAALGLTITSGNFRVQGISTMMLERACDFDAVEPLGYGAGAILSRDGVPYFQGKVASVPKFASGSEEGQALEIADAWGDLEETIYQEEWQTGTTAVLQPRAVLGLGKISGVWTNLTVAQQVTKILEYAIAQGVALQVGSVPTGERLLPTEVSNISCAEAMQMALKFHPDWIPWIDHSTTPPTLNVTPIGSATGAAFTTDGTGVVDSFEVVARQDLLPASVRIVYESADEIDGEIYRKCYVDKYPALGPDGGPQVLTASIPLEGMKAQIQKSRIMSRTLPTTAATAKAWLKEKFPALVALTDDQMQVKVWSLELVTEDDADFPPPVSEQMERMAFSDVSQATHELVRGTLEDWMRRKVGPVRVYFEVVADPALSEALRDVPKSLPSSLIITGTNAVTKTYKSISHWSAAEAVPEGIAQSVYTALHAAMPYQGSVTIVADELPAVPYHGRVISLPPTWAGMAAPVHSVDWDVASGMMTLGFGPAPHLAPADFLEMQRILRARPVTWWSFDERDSGQLGYESGPSAAGDTVAGFESPKSEPTGQVEKAPEFGVSRPFKHATAGTWHVRAEAGYVIAINPEPGAGDPMVYKPVTALTNQTIASGGGLWIKVTTNPQDLVTAAVYHYATSPPTNTHAQPAPGGNDGEYYYHVCSFATVGANVEISEIRHQGGPIIHRPSRNNRNLDLIVHNYYETSTGYLANTLLGSEELIKKVSWRQGDFVGLDAGAATGLIEVDCINLVDRPPDPL